MTNDEHNPTSWYLGFQDAIEGRAGFLSPEVDNTTSYLCGHAIGCEYRRLQRAAEPAAFLHSVMRDKEQTTTDRVSAAAALLRRLEL
jgi:hypothetical protein